MTRVGICALIISGVCIRWLDSLISSTQYPELEAIIALPLFPHFIVHRYTHQGSQSSLAVSWQQIYKSHCHFKSHTKSSLHRLSPFLSIFFNSQLNLISQLSSSYPSRLASRNSTRLLLKWTLLYNHFARTTQKTASLLLGRCAYSAVAQQRKFLDCCLRICCRRNVFIESLPSNDRLFWLYYSGFRARCHNRYITPNDKLLG
jgi:hypothetical protein